MTRRGAAIPPGHRLRVYLAATKSLLENGFPQDPEKLQLLLTGELEFGILCAAYDALSASPEVPGWFERLRQALPGALLPKEGADQPRDFMAELYFATRLRAAHQDIDLSQDEPDVVIEAGSRRYAVAVKRPRRAKSTEDAIGKAVQQIRDSGLTGFIVLDLSLVLDLYKEMKWGTLELMPALNREIDLNIRRLSPKGELQRWVQKVRGHEKVAAMIAQAIVAVPDPNQRAIYLVRTLFCDTIEGFQDRRAARYMRKRFAGAGGYTGKL